MARPFLASTLPERSPVAFFTTIILAARGSCWGPSLGVSPGPGLPLARSTSRPASSHLVGEAGGRGRLDAVVCVSPHLHMSAQDLAGISCNYRRGVDYGHEFPSALWGVHRQRECPRPSRRPWCLE